MRPLPRAWDGMRDRAAAAAANGSRTTRRSRIQQVVRLRRHSSPTVPLEVFRRRLARAEHGSLERLGRCEAQARACRNFDRLTGSRITPHPRLALALAENSETRKAQGAFLFQLADYQRGKLLERRLGVLFGNPGFVGEMRRYLRLRHHPPPCASDRMQSVNERQAICKQARVKNLCFS